MWLQLLEWKLRSREGGEATMVKIKAGKTRDKLQQAGHCTCFAHALYSVDAADFGCRPDGHVEGKACSQQQELPSALFSAWLPSTWLTSLWSTACLYDRVYVSGLVSSICMEQCLPAHAYDRLLQSALYTACVRLTKHVHLLAPHPSWCTL